MPLRSQFNLLLVVPLNTVQTIPLYPHSDATCNQAVFCHCFTIQISMSDTIVWRRFCLPRECGGQMAERLGHRAINQKVAGSIPGCAE